MITCNGSQRQTTLLLWIIAGSIILMQQVIPSSTVIGITNPTHLTRRVMQPAANSAQPSPASLTWTIKAERDVSADIGIPGAHEVKLVRGNGGNDPRGHLPMRIRVVLDDDRVSEFQMEPFDIFTPDARLIGMTERGAVPVTRPTVHLYQGRAVDGSGGTLFLSVNGDEYYAIIRHRGQTLSIQPSGKADGGCLVIPEGVVPPSGTMACSVVGPPVAWADGADPSNADQPLGQVSGTRLEADVMVDVAYGLFTDFGSDATRTANYVATLWGAVSHIYERDINIQIRVSTLVIWMTPQGQFSAPTIQAIHDNYASYVRGNRSNISRDAAHLLGYWRGLGGYAIREGLCSDLRGIAVSSIHGIYRFPVDVPATPYIWDVDVVAHELGHVFGSPHTNCYNPPIDRCIGNEAGCYQGPVSQSPRTIMSNCNNDKGDARLEFHPTVARFIRERAENNPGRCLSALPFMSLRYPTGGETWYIDSTQTIQWNGASGQGVVTIDVSWDGGQTFQTITANAPNRGMFEWTVSGPPTQQAMIKLSSRTDPDAFSRLFTIALPPTEFDGFAQLSPLVLNGHAIETNVPPVVFNGKTVLRLTDNGNQAASAFLSSAIPLVSPDGGALSLSTHFQFQISNARGASDTDGPGGDGLGFAIVADPTSLGGIGAGFINITPSVIIEFDTWRSPNESSGNHVGLNINGAAATNVFCLTPSCHVNTRFNNGSIWYVWIDYHSSSGMLEVRLSPSSTRPTEAFLSRQLDLRAILRQSRVYIGFVAGTGQAAQDHDIRFWSYTVRPQ